MSNLNMLVQQCLEGLKRSSSPSPDLSSFLQPLAKHLYCKKSDPDESTFGLLEALLPELLSRVCVRFASPLAGEQPGKSQSQVFRDAAACVAAKICSVSPELGPVLVTHCMNHLEKCKNCTETLTFLNIVALHSKNVRSALKSPSVYNRLVDLLGGSCGELGGAESISSNYQKMKEEASAKTDCCDTTLAKSLVDTSLHGRKDLDKSVQSEVPPATDQPTEESKNKSATLLRTNYYTNQAASRILRRQQNKMMAVDLAPPGKDSMISPVELPGASSTQNASANRPAIPRLNINQVLAEASPMGAVQTRSSRRAEVTKSASTRSTRYSAIFSSSFDYFHSHSALREHAQQIQGNAHLRQQSELHPHAAVPGSNPRDTSIIDGDTFYMHEDVTTGRGGSASGRLKVLATQLGECCMATDLAALMSQKRPLDPKSAAEDHKVPHSKLSPSETAPLEKPLEGSQFRTLLLSLVAKLVKDMTLIEFAHSRSVTNSIFVYKASRSADSREESCECIRSLKNAGHAREDARSEESGPIMNSFDSFWGAIEGSAHFAKSAVCSEEFAISTVLHKHSLMVECFHHSLSKALPVSSPELLKSELPEERTEEESEKPESLAESVERVQPGADLVEGPGTVTIINGIRYPLHEMDKTGLERVRRQIDMYFYRISRGVSLAVGCLKPNSETAVTVLTQQLQLLAEYISVAKNRVVVQQTVDYLMEPLLKLKAKLIDFALNHSTTRPFFVFPLPKKPKNKITIDIIKVAEMAEMLPQSLKSPIATFLSHRPLEVPPSPASTSQKAAWQKLFAQFVGVIGLLLSHAEDMSLIRLLNETFVSSELWQDMLNIFLLQLFTNSAHTDPECKSRPSLFALSEEPGSDVPPSSKSSDWFNQTVTDLGMVLRYHISLCHMLQKVIRIENIQRKRAGESESQLYWKSTIRKTLSNTTQILKPPEGILARFLSQEPSKAGHTISQGVLEVISHFFSFGPRFSKYFNEEWSLFYIRTHYLSFIRLYNKGMKSGDAKEQQAATELCKGHMRCLLAIAKNRNEETSRNFYKLRCVEFLTREIDLEFDSHGNKPLISYSPDAGVKKRVVDDEAKDSQPIEKEQERKEEGPNHAGVKEDLKGKLKLNLSKLNDPPKVSETAVAAKSSSKEVADPGPAKQKPAFGIKLDLSKLPSGQTSGPTAPNPIQPEPKPENSKPLPSRAIIASGTAPKFPKRNILTSIKASQPPDSEASRVTIVNPPTDVNTSKSRIRPQSRDPKPKLAVDLHKTQHKEADSTQGEGKEETKKVAPRAASTRPADPSEKGTIVGSNKVWVPLLKFPQNLDNYKEEAEGVIKIERPNENRFKLKRFGKDELNKTFTQPPAAEGTLETRKPRRSAMLLDTGAGGFMGKPSLAPPKVEPKEAKKEVSKEPPPAVPQIESPKDTLTEEEQIAPKKEKAKIPLLKLAALKKKDSEQSYKERKEAEVAKVMKEDKGEGKLTTMEKSLAQGKNKWQLIREGTGKGLLSHHDTGSISQSSSSMGSIVRKGTEKPDEPLTTGVTKERTERGIYKDPELHALMIGLLFGLLLKPPRGVLDELYCSANPLDNGKQNVLYLLHFHLNHPLNQPVLPLVLSIVEKLRPPLAGQRLLKLLCKRFFDVKIYGGWRKIGTGAFGTVFECSTTVIDPAVVAIKQLSFPNSIYGRCVLYDIFNEIASLQELRGEQCATTLHDYGVDDNNYYIVMKRYAGSLRDWRLKQTGGLGENLSIYLQIFKQALHAVEVTHSHNVTHYDLKCDNFMLEMKGEDETTIGVALGDYGECKLFTNEDDEYDLKPRGTECIKSPEMLTLTINTRKDTDKYDRRRKVGTTRTSDIWSLGCMLYELLTGEYLFSSEDYVLFYLRVTSENEEVLTDDKKEMLDNNVYLIDFLNFLLIRDSGRRPDIAKVVGRFKHLHALLVNAGVGSVVSILPSVSPSATRGFAPLDSLLETAGAAINPKGKQELETIEEQVPAAKGSNPSLMRVMKNVYLCSAEYLYQNRYELIKDSHVTHVVLPAYLYRDNLAEYFSILKLKTCKCGSDSNQSLTNAYAVFPALLDYLRKVALARGVVLFVDDEPAHPCAGCKTPRQSIIKEALLSALGYVLQTSGYETWTLCNSQVLFLTMTQDCLGRVAKWTGLVSKITVHTDTYPKYACLCGSCTFVLARGFADPKNLLAKNCSCDGSYGKPAETSECPTRGCTELLGMIKNRYGLKWEYMKWGYFEKADFLVGPTGCGMQKNGIYRKVILNSQGSEENAECCEVTEKNVGEWGSEVTQRWILYRCRTCHVWTYAMSPTDNKIALVLNNPIGTFFHCRNE